MSFLSRCLGFLARSFTTHRVHRGFTLILTNHTTSLAKLSQQTRGAVQGDIHFVSHFRAGGLGILFKESNKGIVLSLALKLSFSRLRRAVLVSLCEHLNLMVDERNLISISESGADSNKHFGLSHGKYHLSGV